MGEINASVRTLVRERARGRCEYCSIPAWLSLVEHQHFRTESGRIAGITATGRATVRLLQLNRAERVHERSAM